MPPSELAKWRLARKWGEPLDLLLDEGGALGVDWERPTYSIELTSSLYGPGRFFWVRVTSAAGRVFTPPMPVHRSEVSILLSRWGFGPNVSWSESTRMKQDGFRGSIPRSFVLQPGPYWYITQDAHDEEMFRVYFDKMAPSARSKRLSLIVGPALRYFGLTPCSKLPEPGDPCRLSAEFIEVLTEATRGSTEFFSKVYLSRSAASGLEELCG